jgi:CopG family nickel-responsive transcriptional regulator
MQRISMTIDDDLLATLDALMARRGYGSRSEAVRDIVRDAIGRERRTQAPDTQCVGTLTYVYEHEKRELARRLTDSQHHRHDLTIATLHVHLDHDSCLEVAVLRGALGEVQSLADEMTTQRGVSFGHLHIVPAEIDAGDHHHGPHGHGHTHIKVQP